MRGARYLQGVSCTIERIHREEGDARRHKNNCYYYGGGYCVIRKMQCPGSAHCEKYIDVHKNDDKMQKLRDFMDTRNKTPEFEGFKLIKFSTIKLPQKYRNQEIDCKKVNEIIDYFYEYHTLDKPIMVSCGRDGYILSDGFLRYVAAERLGLNVVYVQIGTYETAVKYDQLRTLGVRVYHADYGFGKVVAHTIFTTTILFNKDKSGEKKRRKLGLVACVDKDLLKIVPDLK